MVKCLLKIFFISFALNFIWEISQMGLYSETGMGSLANYNQFIKIHWLVSIKDALMVVFVVVAISLITRNYWMERINRMWLWLLVLPVWQGIIEYHAVHIAQRWAYSDVMPLILGIGLLPLLQMLILPPLAILASNSAFGRKGV